MLFFLKNNYIFYAFLATMFTFLVTFLGALIVFVFKKVNRKLLDISNALASGIMISASFFSLLNPAFELAKNIKLIPWLIVSCGFLFGGLFILLSDIICEKIIKKYNKINLKKSIMLVLSITLHNIPEGLAVGVAFGSIIYGIEGATLISAMILTLGIGIQNFPEGALVSLPLRENGMSRKKSFIIGALTGIVEPISGVIGAFLVIKIRYLLPFLLSFASSAMIYVACSELIPECEKNDSKYITFLIIIGFTLMMILDVIFE